MVSITGCTRAGIAVAKSAAADLKRAHLEPAGKAPVVVFDDADIAAAIEGISVAGLVQRRPGLYGGHPGARAARIYDEFVGALTDAAKNTKTGYDPADEDILYGPINNANQLGARVPPRGPGARPRQSRPPAARVGERGYSTS